MFKKVLFALILSISPTLAQSSAGQSVIGFYLAPGQTSGSFTCKANNIGSCFVPYGASVPTSVGTSGVAQGSTTSGQTITPVGCRTSSSVVVDTTGTTNMPACTVNGALLVSPLTVAPITRTIVALDVSTVTTGGTAVTALTAGHRTAGGFICNPVGASINLGLNEQGTASGTTSAGATTFIIPGQCYTLSPLAGAVSIITSDSAHPFSGYGLN